MKSKAPKPLSVVSAYMREIGKRGGKRRAAKMTKDARSESARRAVNVRWKRKGGQ